MILTKTYHSKSPRPHGRGLPLFEEGFTLIEMMVVVCIIVLISAMAMPSVSSYFQLSLNSATREMASAIKEAYNATAVTGKVHRIVYDFKNNSYWVESGPPDALLDTKESKEKEERKKRYMKTKEDTAQFKLETTITRKKKSLPRGVEFEDVITQQSPDPILTGEAYTHFFTNGLTEQTLVHLKDQSKHHVTLAIKPLIGMTDVYDRYVNAKELLEQ